jgi:prepilin-type N-terminal cleavage/methylation domain-containing protein
VIIIMPAYQPLYGARLSQATTAEREPRREGMTLIEMLVATTVTLVLMAAIGQVFSRFGSSVSGSRAALDMNARMRTAAWRLRQDLSGATAPAIPPLDPADGLGYFEVIEGPRHDADAADGTNSLEADIDDALLFTTTATVTPFRGAFAGQTMDSNIAEVAWFARPTVPATSPATYTIYRKQMLVVGYVGAGPFNAGGSQNRIPFSSLAAPQWRTLYDTYDLSVSRRNAAGPGVDMFVPNTLTDLTKREHRFMHNLSGDTTGLPVPAGQFPYAFVNHLTPLAGGTLPPGLEGLVFDAASPRFGEDVILNNVIAFDVRVFDPAAPIASSPSGNDVVTPLEQNSPPGPSFPAGPFLANGAYVDLGNGITTAGPSGVPPRFAGFGSPLSRLAGSPTAPCVYDTWSTHYEADGVDQDGVAGTDQGSNGVDDPIPARLSISAIAPDGVIDDIDEWETKPPYPYPLRGIEVRIRCYDPSSRRVRQVTVRHSFVQ